MGIRQTINENPAITTGVTIAIIVLTLGIIIYMTMGSSGPRTPSGPIKQYYSDDDGQTFFVVDQDVLPPIPSPKNPGKEAYRVTVFKCGNGAPFVTHLEKFAPDAKSKIEQMRAQSPNKSMPLVLFISGTRGDMQVKKPGKGKPWVKWSSKDANQYQEVLRPVCPNGQTGDMQLVTP